MPHTTGSLSRFRARRTSARYARSWPNEHLACPRPRRLGLVHRSTSEHLGRDRRRRHRRHRSGAVAAAGRVRRPRLRARRGGQRGRRRHPGQPQRVAGPASSRAGRRAGADGRPPARLAPAPLGRRADAAARRPRRRRRRCLRLPALPDAPRRPAGRAGRRAAARAPARRPPASAAWPTTAIASRRRSRTARRSRSTSSSAPTASTRPSARCCSARRTRVFTGCAAYRGLVPAERLAHLDLEVTAQIWMGPERPLRALLRRRRRLVNFVAVIEQDSWTRESWTDPGDPADAIAAFEGWHPQLHEILGAVDDTFIWALFDRPPLARWSRGRVTLLGDACHAMLPFMAQGAAQALEDGATLTACLTTRARRPRGPAPLRVAAPAARVAHPGAVDREQDALPPARRARAARARRGHGGRRDRLRPQGRRVDLRARRGGGRRSAPTAA